MWPTQPTNLDVCFADSITPTANLTYNNGQDKLRWLHIFADRVVTSNLIFGQLDNYSAAVVLTGADVTRIIRDTEKSLVDITLLKADQPLYALKTVVKPISTDVAKLKTDLAAADVTKLKNDLAALTTIVNKMNASPLPTQVSFWNSIRRESVGSGTTLEYLYFIPSTYISGGTGFYWAATNGLTYCLVRLQASNITSTPD
jgi:hypothetical protein